MFFANSVNGVELQIADLVFRIYNICSTCIRLRHHPRQRSGSEDELSSVNGSFFTSVNVVVLDIGNPSSGDGQACRMRFDGGILIAWIRWSWRFSSISSSFCSCMKVSIQVCMRGLVQKADTHLAWLALLHKLRSMSHNGFGRTSLCHTCVASFHIARRTRSVGPATIVIQLCT